MEAAVALLATIHTELRIEVRRVYEQCVAPKDLENPEALAAVVWIRYSAAALKQFKRSLWVVGFAECSTIQCLKDVRVITSRLRKHVMRP